MMTFLLFAPASTKWLEKTEYRKDRISPRDRLGRFCDICQVFSFLVHIFFSFFLESLQLVLPGRPLNMEYSCLGFSSQEQVDVQEGFLLHGLFCQFVHYSCMIMFCKFSQRTPSDTNGENISVPTTEEGTQSLQFLSEEYDDLHSFRESAKDDLKRLSVRLARVEIKVDAISNAMRRLKITVINSMLN